MDCEVLSGYGKDLVEFYSAGQGELEEMSSSLWWKRPGRGDLPSYGLYFTETHSQTNLFFISSSMSLALEKKMPLPEFSLLVEFLAWQACFPVGTMNLPV